jgi:hypothetical protein
VSRVARIMEVSYIERYFCPQTARKNSFDEGSRLEGTRNEFKEVGCEVVSLVHLACRCVNVVMNFRVP